MRTVVLAEAKQAVAQAVLVFVVGQAVVVVGDVVMVAVALAFAVEVVTRNDPQKGNVVENIRYHH